MNKYVIWCPVRQIALLFLYKSNWVLLYLVNMMPE